MAHWLCMGSLMFLILGGPLIVALYRYSGTTTSHYHLIQKLIKNMPR